MATQRVTYHSEAFRDPFKKGLVTTLERERTGWETDREPCEETLVVFLQHAAQFIADGNYDDYELRYISGLVSKGDERMNTTFKLVEQEEAHSQQYRTDLPAYAYIRFSTMEQVKNSLQSKKMQDVRMKQKIMRAGFPESSITTKDKDEGISAQKGVDKRADLADIYRAMKEGRCGLIAAFDASRLWRFIRLNTSELNGAMTVADRRYMDMHPFTDLKVPVFQLPDVDIAKAAIRAGKDHL